MRRRERIFSSVNSAPTLRHGEFFGSRIAQRKLGSFTLSLTEYDDAGELPLHEHDETYVTFVVDGSYRERAGGSARDCTPRSLIVHPAGERHANHFAGGRARCLNVQFDAAWLRTSFDRPAIVKTPAAAAIGARAVRELRHDDPFSPLVIEGLMLELFAEVERHSNGARVPVWLRDVRSLIGKRYTEKLALADLASFADVHPVHLARAFRHHYGCTIGETVRDLRIEHAKRRIAEGAELSDIALESGFADQSHFARTFRRLTGATPASFRRARG